MNSKNDNAMYKTTVNSNMTKDSSQILTMWCGEAVHNDTLVCLNCFKTVSLELVRPSLMVSADIDKSAEIARCDDDYIMNHLRIGFNALFDHTFKCGMCGNMMTLIDSDMCDIIYEFHCLGMYTRFSCIGGKSTSVAPYVKFMMNIDVIDTLINKLKTLEIITDENILIKRVNDRTPATEMMLDKVSDEYSFLKDFMFKKILNPKQDVIYILDDTSHIEPKEKFLKLIDILAMPIND